MKTIQILNGDSLEVLKQYPDNYFDAVVTDPPYGLGKEPNAEQMLQAWITSGYLEVKGSGFMGKEWDAFVPQPIFWKEVFRVLKHGGHIVAFFGTRTYDWGVMAMRLAGFEVRDCIQWIYGSGFPKSHNIGKAIDKMHGAEREVIDKGRSGSSETHLNTMNSQTKDGKSVFGGEYDITIPSTEEAKQWEGWGSALKPANEPIVLARKPLEKGLSIAENVLKNGTGGINIDATRVGLSEGDDSRLGGNGSWKTDKSAKNVYEGGYEGKEIESSALGRFPANLILTHHPECECMGTKKVKAIGGGTGDKSMGGLGVNGKYGKYALDKLASNAGGLGDENGEETIESWNCHEDCPIKIMDEQSGESKSTIRKPTGKPILNVEKGWNNNSMINNRLGGHNDKGGASRFFYVAKASKKERNKGLEAFEEKIIEGRDIGQDERNVAYKPRPTPMANIHPTIKPVALMRYLVRMITPPNGIVLDPFNGSGTTGVACKVEGFKYVGIELDAEYCKISEARIEGWEEEIEMPETIQQNEVKKEIVEQEIPKNQLNLF
jgi:site-specific DNA-methyltransferase (adenine-specific)